MQFQKKITNIFCVLIISLLGSSVIAKTGDDFDRALLIGNWSCTDNTEYLDYDLYSQGNLSFKSNHEITTLEHIKLQNNIETALYEVHSMARWHLEESKLIIDKNQLLTFHTDNAELESKLNLKETWLDTDPIEFYISILDKDEMKLNLMLSGIEVEHSTCIRNKKTEA